MITKLNHFYSSCLIEFMTSQRGTNSFYQIWGRFHRKAAPLSGLFHLNETFQVEWEEGGMPW